MSIKKLNNELSKFAEIFKKTPIQLHEPDITDLEKIYVRKALDENQVSTSGYYTKVFEKKLSKITKSKYVVPVLNGSYALYLSLLSLKIKKGNEILLQNLNYIASANAIISVGAIPHFIDNNESDLGIDCEKLEKYLIKNTKLINKKCINKKTNRVIQAIIPMHTFGMPSEIKKIIKIAKKFKLHVIEDAAEALGSSFQKKQLGTFGDIGILSFNGNKIVTSGTGGAILTSNKKIYQFVKHKSQICKINHPWMYSYDDIGYNLKLPSINSALGIAQLTRIKIFLRNKKKIFLTYKKFFSKSKNFQIMDSKRGSKSNYWLNTILLNDNLSKYKNNVIEKLIKKKIFVRPAWQLLNEINHLRKYPKMNLSKSKNLFDRIINIPSGSKVLQNIKR